MVNFDEWYELIELHIKLNKYNMLDFIKNKRFAIIYVRIYLKIFNHDLNIHYWIISKTVFLMLSNSSPLGQKDIKIADVSAIS